MLEEKIARVKKLIEQREKIETELSSIFGMTGAPKRGRPRKDQANGSAAEQTAESTPVGPSGV